MADDSKSIAWLNGEFVSLLDAKLHVFDRGLVHGAAVTEMLRTFRHQLFRMDEHLDRFMTSVEAVGIPLTISRAELCDILQNVAQQNASLISENSDLGAILFATLGENPTYVGRTPDRQPFSVCVHTFELQFELWSEKLRSGQSLVIPPTRAIPPECINPRIKHRSRLHWILADQQARQIDSKASALVLDMEGKISETSSGNFFAVLAGEIVTPPDRRCLGGISQSVVKELAHTLEIPYRSKDLTPDDLSQADEAFTTSTPYCLLPVATVDQQAIGKECPGPICRKLQAAWNELVGMDMIAQVLNQA